MKPVRCVVRVPVEEVADPSAINTAAAKALQQMKEIVRSADFGWTITSRDVELVEATIGEGIWAKSAFLLFRGTPTEIPKPKRLRRR